MAAAAFPIAAARADQSFYDEVLAHLKAAKDPEKLSLYERTLTAFEAPKLLQRTLDYAVSDARLQDAGIIIGRVMQNQHGEKLAWNFVTSRWGKTEKMNGAFGGSSAAGLVASTGSFCDPAMRDQVKDFFAAHPVPTAERTLKQSLERIDYCIDVKQGQGPELASWLQSKRGEAGK